MNGWLRKPRAQSRDAATRRTAVSDDAVESLGAPLADFARNDADASVRLAALRRAADLDLSVQRSREDPDASLRTAAQQLAWQLFSGQHAQSPALAQRLDLLSSVTDKALLEHLARHGAETDLRETVLLRLDRGGALLEAVTSDPDPALRLRLLRRVDDLAQLQRIAEQARRRDKRIHQAARERIRELQIQAGDPQAIADVALELCAQTEQMTTVRPNPTQLEAIEVRWAALGTCIPEALQTRYRHAREQCVAAMTAPDSAQATAPMQSRATAPDMAEPEHPSATVPPAPPEVQKLAAETRFQASLAAGLDQSPARKPVKPAVRAATLLEQMEQALERGDLTATLAHQKRLSRLHPDAQPDLAARWQRASARSAELQRWQHWSNRRQRRQLCVDARSLRDSGLHPDAVATRVAELRQAWRRLDQLEPPQSSAHPVEAGLTRRFHALCQRALAPTRVYFETRDRLRNEQTAQIKALLDEAEPETDDFKSMALRRRKLADARRELDRVDPRQRHALGARLTRGIKALDAPLEAHYQHVNSGQQALIDRARQLLELPSAQQPSGARALQSEWKALGPGRRDLDRKQWKAFRAACDAVFKALDQEREQSAAEQQEKQDQACALLKELADAAKLTDLTALQQIRRDTQQQWRQIDLRDRQLSSQWQDALSRIDQHIRAIELQARQQHYRDWLADIAAGNTAQGLPAILQQAVTERSTQSAAADTARDIVLRMEAMAGIDSPVEDHQQRMALNLRRLQATLGEGRRQNRDTERDNLLAEWIRMGPLPHNELALAARFERALTGLLSPV